MKNIQNNSSNLLIIHGKEGVFSHTFHATEKDNSSSKQYEVLKQRGSITSWDFPIMYLGEKYYLIQIMVPYN